jgi:P-type Ca2+ transporter type 2C
MPAKKIKKIDDVKPRAKGSPKPEWYNLGLVEVAKKLDITKQGLTERQVEERTAQYGKNILPKEPPIPWVVLFLRQFKSSLTYILLVAAAISFGLGERVDAYVILAAVIINVIVGFLQENKAQKALESLKRIITHNVWVVRDGEQREIESKELVPGDLVVLLPGNRVAADGRLIEAEHLSINEAALTGESVPTEKINHALEGKLILADRHNMVFSGSTVLAGHGRFLVTATGAATELGSIATLVKETKTIETPLQLKLNRFSKKLGTSVLGLSVLLFGIGIYSGLGFVEMFVTAVAVAVAVIPEGLLVAVTVVLAVGMRRILAKGSLVRKLVAAETLGSTNVICADKTGTITLGEMRVSRLVTEHNDVSLYVEQKSQKKENKKESDPIELKKLHQIGIYCSDAVVASAEPHHATSARELEEHVVVGSATERALLLSAEESGFSQVKISEPRARLDEIPFDSRKKFMATLNLWTKKQHIIYVKGAPEKIIAMAGRYQSGKSMRTMSEKKRTELLKQYMQLSKQGLRVLVGAYKGVPVTSSSFDELPDYNEDLVFVGFWGIKDPIRPEAKEMLRQTKKAGIRPIMITGDNQYTALAIARELGLKTTKEAVIDGAQFAGMSKEELGQAVKEVQVFSRTTPEDKLKIVEALQSHGDVVAMTGDGVNDAPALTRADIGLALGSGTDVAKGTADVVLLDNNFSTIVAAVRQGRIIFDNIRKVMLYLLANSLTEVLVIIVGLLLGWPLPLLAAQVLWINLVTDGLPDLALTQEPEEPESMSEKPHKRDAPILDFERKFLIIFISLITAGFTLGIFYLIWKSTGDIDRARTVAFTAIGIESLLYVFSVRSIRHSIFETNHLGNRWLIAAVCGGFVIQLIGVYAPFFQQVLRTVPLSISEWALILFTCFWIIAFIELVKHYFIAQRRSAVSS